MSPPGTDLGNQILTLKQFSTVDGGASVEPQVDDQKVAFVDTEGMGDQGDEYEYEASEIM